jgi:mRNA-degrading endonuclease toxin of MazEF toxin-antitoxin module
MTPPTIACRRGDVVLALFTFADEQGAKRRPALVLSGAAYHRGRREVILAAITSNVARLLPGDYLLEAWRAAGLLYPSVVTAIIRTARQDRIARRLGAVAAADMQGVEAQVRLVLGL